MSAFNNNYNFDDVLIRSTIVGLVNELNNKIYFYNVWKNDKDKRLLVRVPFFYAQSGDERFIQDAFSNWNDCYPDFIEGNTDPIPRGVIWLTGASILSANLTNRYVRGSYTKEEDGQIKQYNSYINSIPIQLNFSMEIMVDTSLDSFKVIESAISVLYKTLVFSVNYNGFRVPTQAGFPENFALNKQFEFTYGVTDRPKVSFDVEVQTYLPIPDKDNEMFAGNRITSFSSTVNTDHTIITPIVNVTVTDEEKSYINPGNNPL